MTARPPGMDHPHYPFWPIPERPRLLWPGGKALAVTTFLYFEHWESFLRRDAVVDPRLQDPFGKFEPDYRAITIRQYGLRVGIFRILDALDASGLKVTVAANAEALERYPFLVEQFLRRGYEIAAHGRSSSGMVSSRMTRDQESELIDGCLGAVETATGSPARGWVSQDYGESTITPELIARAGLSYIADWANDDQPYPLSTPTPLMSIPNQADLDDVQLLWHRRIETPKYVGIMRSAVNLLEKEGATSGRFLGLHIHPWLFGMPHRIKYLEQTLADITQRTSVWSATATEVADATRAFRP